MKRIDFKFHNEDDDNKGKPIVTEASILKQKEDLLRIALKEIEGPNFPSEEDMKKHGGISRGPDYNTTLEEIVTWKGKTILWTKIKGNQVLFKFLYQV